jgi:hypothetical protein
MRLRMSSITGGQDIQYTPGGGGAVGAVVVGCDGCFSFSVEPPTSKVSVTFWLSCVVFEIAPPPSLFMSSCVSACVFVVMQNATQVDMGVVFSERPP